jgi:hypothetical protein
MLVELRQELAQKPPLEAVAQGLLVTPTLAAPVVAVALVSHLRSLGLRSPGAAAVEAGLRPDRAEVAGLAEAAHRA